MGVGGDFAAFACDFQNLTFCGADIGNIAGGYIFNWPISQWATRVKFNFAGFGYFQVGAYDQNQQYLGFTQATLPVFYPGSTGALVPAELAWLPKFAGGMLPGSYKFGGWYSTSTAPDVTVDVNGNPTALTHLPPRFDRGLYGVYINFQQQLTRNSSPNPQGGLRAFLNAVSTDKQTSVTDRQIAAGLAYTGLLSWRPNDEIAFAAGTTHVNSRLAEIEALRNALGMGPVGVQHSEYIYELYYTVAAATGLIFRPNLQYVVTPGGTSVNKNVVVLGLKTLVSF
jgi:porin